MPIDGRSRLGAEVAVPGVEIECAGAVFAADAPELHATLDPIGGVVSHGLIVAPAQREGRTTVRLSKVIFGRPCLCEHDRTVVGELSSCYNPGEGQTNGKLGGGCPAVESRTGSGSKRSRTIGRSAGGSQWSEVRETDGREKAIRLSTSTNSESAAGEMGRGTGK
jgi:hypothetical protein